MGYEGGRFWITGDVIECLRPMLDDGKTVSEAMRVVLNLETPILKFDRKPTNHKYPVHQLGLGDSLRFDAGINPRGLRQSVLSQAKKFGFEFRSIVQEDGLVEITRIG